MKIITDTREQKPLFKKTIFRKLEVGDYTTTKLENKFHIERKSLSDLYGTLTVGNTRFKYELFRAEHFRIKMEVFIEGSFDDFINKRFPKGEERKFTSQGLERLVKTFERKYFLKFVWCKTRKNCVSSVEKRLFEIDKKS